jgi:transcriptional regulator with XRE-family HTH domain
MKPEKKLGPGTMIELPEKYGIFRRNLVRLRGLRGISASELTVELQLKSPKRISDIEEGRGKITLDEACKICKFFGYNIDEMLYKEARATISFDPPY